ncbi:MAG: hypothetical protein ABIH35_00245 [Patescibacteria group bacterium]
MARSKHPPKRNYFVRIVGPVLIIGLTLVLALSGRTENEILRPADITSEFIGQRLQLMQDWFLANERLGQTLPYLYYPERKEYSNDDNIVRQLLATQGIFVLARELSSPELEQLAFRQLAATLLEYYREESETGFGFFEGNGTVKLGGAALGIITILESPQPEIYGVKLSKLADFIRAMQQLDGSFQTFYRPPDFERNERFYSGEALLAAARLARYTGDSSWLDYVEHGLTYYEPLLKTRFMPQFAPWHTMAYSEMFEQTGEQKYADFVFYLNDRLIDEMLQTDVADPAQLGRFYNSKHDSEWGPPHSSSTAVYTEGITYAYDLAMRLGNRERAERYRNAIRLGTRSLLQLQYTERDSQDFEYPERIKGAIRRATDRKEIRIDQTGHTANALPRVSRILKNPY